MDAYTKNHVTFEYGKEKIIAHIDEINEAYPNRLKVKLGLEYEPKRLMHDNVTMKFDAKKIKGGQHYTVIKPSKPQASKAKAESKAKKEELTAKKEESTSSKKAESTSSKAKEDAAKIALMKKELALMKKEAALNAKAQKSESKAKSSDAKEKKPDSKGKKAETKTKEPAKAKEPSTPIKAKKAKQAEVTLTYKAKKRAFNLEDVEGEIVKMTFDLDFKPKFVHGTSKSGDVKKVLHLKPEALTAGKTYAIVDPNKKEKKAEKAVKTEPKTERLIDFDSKDNQDNWYY